MISNVTLSFPVLTSASSYKAVVNYIVPCDLSAGTSDKNLNVNTETHIS